MSWRGSVSARFITILVNLVMRRNNLNWLYRGSLIGWLCRSCLAKVPSPLAKQQRRNPLSNARGSWPSNRIMKGLWLKLNNYCGRLASVPYDEDVGNTGMAIQKLFLTRAVLNIPPARGVVLA